MCGGIVGAFSLQRRVIPIRAELSPVSPSRLLAFNAGRIATYAGMGTVAGALGGALDAQVALYVLANVALVLTGLYLAGLGGALARLESLAAPPWRRLQPMATWMLSRNVFLAGMLWGFLPCGLVYGALAAAAFAANPIAGATAMAAFGLGTLPFLLAAGLAFARLRGRLFRSVAGGSVLAFGIYGLAHAGEVADGIRRGLFCF
jgi:sulfite exporter TauE/SafE